MCDSCHAIGRNCTVLRRRAVVSNLQHSADPSFSEAALLRQIGQLPGQGRYRRPRRHCRVRAWLFQAVETVRLHISKSSHRPDSEGRLVVESSRLFSSIELPLVFWVSLAVVSQPLKIRESGREDTPFLRTQQGRNQESDRKQDEQ